ncbi:MAG: hypothetical protein FJ030_04710 [Chloroflexi bacterium]|nr:hypothetical protein [Chloroflexota bacterium]
MAVDRQGNVYIVANGNIYKYTETGKLIGQLEYSGGQGFQDVAVTAEGGLAATWNKDWRGGLFVNFNESQDDIAIFDSEGQVVNVLPKALSQIASGNAELDSIIAVDDEGNIYASGLTNQAIFKFTPDGNFVDKFGDGKVNGAADIAIDSQGRVFVANSGEILIFDSDGVYLGLIDTSASDLTFNDAGELLAIDDPQIVKFEINR